MSTLQGGCGITSGSSKEDYRNYPGARKQIYGAQLILFIEKWQRGNMITTYRCLEMEKISDAGEFFSLAEKDITRSIV